MRKILGDYSAFPRRPELETQLLVLGLKVQCAAANKLVYLAHAVRSLCRKAPEPDLFQANSPKTGD